MLINSDESCLLIVDIQSRLLPVMADPDAVVGNTRLLMRAAGRLGVPVLASEQYPRGIGHTVSPVAELLPDNSVVEKMHFSCLREDFFADRLEALGRRQAVVAGIEAHVCVLQTADDLVSAGYDVFVVADATSSRTHANHQAALARLEAAGAHLVTTEMVVFEWMAKAGTPEFRELVALIK
ncbi:MAG: hydrolase [Rhodospirillales bacterium]|nr:hydrolase [Rhodospirillales bacterium]